MIRNIVSGLTIGSWVATNQDYAKVTALYNYDGQMRIEADLIDDQDVHCEVEVCLEGLEAIPLTKELLLGNGWQQAEKEPDAFFHPQLGEENKVIIKPGEIPSFNDINTPYVHQLQILFAILDIDMNGLKLVKT